MEVYTPQGARLIIHYHKSVDRYDLEDALFARFDTEFDLTNLFSGMEDINGGYFPIDFGYDEAMEYFKQCLDEEYHSQIDAVTLFLKEEFPEDESILVYVSY